MAALNIYDFKYMESMAMSSLTQTHNHTLYEHFEYAERTAAAHNSRFTPIRRHIYKCLLETDRPLGAYDILDMLDGIGSAKPPTVYRTLDWLMEMGLVKKIESLSKYMAATNEQLALLLCQTCGHAETFDAGPALESLGNLARARGFQEQQTVIEILGQCSVHKCAEHRIDASRA